jgi:hypothetical protein
MENAHGIEIEIGDWIVSAAGPDQDAGQVLAIHDDGTATVAWEAGACKVRDRIATECDVYETRVGALQAAFGRDGSRRQAVR